MKNHQIKGFRRGRSELAAIFVVGSATLLAGPVFAGEREDALALCRSAIAQAHQVSADEAGAHFRDSTTSARAYIMRFDVQAENGAARQLLTCKVKRGALVIAELSLNGPDRVERAELSGAPDAAQPSAR